MKCGIIIAAAGQGKRLGLKQNKILFELAGKPMLIYSLDQFKDLPWVNEIIVVVHEEEVELIEQLLKLYGLDQRVEVVVGGSERQHSIANGLARVTSDYVMVHDAARPFVSGELIRRLYERLYDVDAVIPGIPVVDTIKLVDKYQRVMETLNRDQLWAIQTPQAFARRLLVEAYERARTDGFVGTDDASLVEWIGVDVEVVAGDEKNLKVTRAADLEQAERMLTAGSEEDD